MLVSLYAGVRAFTGVYVRCGDGKRGQNQMGSLTGAVRRQKVNAGGRGLAQRGLKSHLEPTGLC